MYQVGFNRSCWVIVFTSYVEFNRVKPRPLTNMYSIKFNIHHHVFTIYRDLHATYEEMLTFGCSYLQLKILTLLPH